MDSSYRSARILPDPDCVYGYTEESLLQILGDRYEDFAEWMYGQTMTLCPQHGAVAYAWDLANYLRGGKVVD